MRSGSTLGTGMWMVNTYATIATSTKIRRLRNSGTRHDRIRGSRAFLMDYFFAT
jgi:hypothetical protein